MVQNQRFDKELYSKLNSYRNLIFKHYCYYNNTILREFARSKPVTKKEILKIEPDKEKFEAFGANFIQIIKEHLNYSERTIFSELDENYLTLKRTHDIEARLYEIIQIILKTDYPEGERDWWYKGVPANVRTKAAEQHELSGGKVPKEYALYLINLKEIIVNKWPSFKNYFDEDNKGKPEFGSWFNRLNDIRNRLSHRMRLNVQPLSEEDHKFVEDRLQWIESIYENSIETPLVDLQDL